MLLGILIISIPLLIYVAGALSVTRKDVSHPDDFFIAYKRVGVTAFASSSIAYAFQVSTIYPFLLWGASGFYFVPAVNTLCWGLGIFLFFLSFNQYKQFIGRDITLHGFLGSQYGASVRIVASYLTIIGFLGFAIAEVYFGSKVLLSIIENRNLFYIVIVGASLLVYGYIAYGGQLSSIRTDQLQLVISYTGIFGLMLYFFFVVIRNGVPVSGMLSAGLLILVIYIPVLLARRKFRFIKLSEMESPVSKLTNVLLNSGVSLLLISIFVTAVFKLLRGSADFHVENLINTEGFGTAGLLSLILLPLLWQFVDLTNWQRLLSVKPDQSETVESVHSNIRKGLLTYALESPFTWIIFLFFGLLTVTALPHFTFQDLLIDLPRQLISSPSLAHRFFGYTFIISILSIMLSTVDSFIVGAIFTFVYDSFGRTRRLLDRKDERTVRSSYAVIINSGRIFGLLLILAGTSLFIFFDKHVPNGGELFINLLLAFYSAQLSFFPLIFGILFLRRHPSAFWANASMLSGAVTGISIGIYSVIWNQAYAWYPILGCISLSVLVYSLGWGLKSQNS